MFTPHPPRLISPVSCRPAAARLAALLLAALLPGVPRAHAQTSTNYAGVVDSGFTPPAGLAGDLDEDFNPAGSIQASLLQPDGKLVLVGSQIRGIVRLNADGTKDTTFNVGQGTDGEVSAVTQQDDGAILIGGEFITVSGATSSYLTRLNPDGSLDTAYTPQLDAPVRALTMLSTGQTAVGGEFSTLNGAAANKLARLNSDGTADPAFQSALGADGPVYSICEHPDGSGRLLVGGAFGNLGGTPRANLGQVNSDGSADTTFDPGTLPATGTSGTDGTVQVVRYLTDGTNRALVGGSFANVGPTAQAALVQLLPSGAADPTFQTGATSTTTDERGVQRVVKEGISGGSGQAATVYSLDVQKDGKVIIGGLFSKVAGKTSNAVARLNSDGSLDSKYNSSGGANASVRAVKLQPDGKAVVAGSFTQIDSASLGGVGRLTADDGTAAFFAGQVAVGGSFYYLQFPNGNPFGYFALEGNGFSFPFLFHADLGFEYFLDANDGYGGAYLYDFTSSDFFYTSPTFPFPYLYDFGLNAFLYYYPDPSNPGHYNTDGIRYFYNFNTQQIISK